MCFSRRSVFPILLTGLLGIWSSAANADDWTGSSSDLFSEPLNWLDLSAPGPAETANFPSSASPGDVIIDSAITVAALNVLAGSTGYNFLPSGGGSLSVSGTLSVGNSGTTTVLTLGGLNVLVGQRAQIEGKVLIGPGGAMTLSSGATANIINAGEVESSNPFHFATAGTGTLLVDGAGSRLTSTSSGTSVWASGVGSSATVTFNTSAVGSFANGGLDLAVAGGNARVTLQNNALLTVGSLRAGGAGAATISVAGGSLHSLGDAQFGTGALVAITGGSLILGGNSTFSSGARFTWGIGNASIASGRTLAFEGGAGTISLGKGLSNGATLRIAAGGSFTASNFLDIGNSLTGGATGTMIIDGPGSTLTSSGIYSDWGTNAGNSATITISNSGAATYNSGVVLAANNGTARVNLLSGGRLNTSSFVSGSTLGAATVTLNGGTLLVTDEMTLYRGSFIHFTGGSLEVGNDLIMGENARIVLSAAADKVLRVGGLYMFDTSQIDLTNNDLVIDYDTESQLDLVSEYVLAGKLASEGLYTSLGTSTTLGLGYAEASALGITSFSGLTVDSTSVLVKYTRYGDADLNGEVDVRDLLRLANGWLGAGSWADGDFNSDGTVNPHDLTLLAVNWQAGVGAPLAVALEQLGLPALSIPEPVGIGFIALASLGAVGSRRRATRR